MTDNEGKLHTKKLNNVLYFTDSTVNIISSTELDESPKDDEGTWELTKTKYSIFNWDYGKYKKTIAHSENCLPELEILTGIIKFSGFCNRLGSISIDYTFKFAFSFVCTRKDTITIKKGFYPRG